MKNFIAVCVWVFNAALLLAIILAVGFIITEIVNGLTIWNILLAVLITIIIIGFFDMVTKDK